MTAYVLEDEFIRLHLLTGSIIMGLVIFRLVWGIAGTGHARFTSFTPSLSSVKQHLRDLIRMQPSRHTGHTPAGSIMIYLLLAGLLLLTTSGLMLYGLEEGSGPLASVMDGMSYETGVWIKEVHPLIADTLALFILLHVAGVFIESILQKQNLIMAMITGRKYVTQKEDEA
ncbi:MAG: cytochrome b/b6 domain-containing protein [Mariprofundaceae bacterium]|nr:cytochrome b/b6 domain-containing protein [Mariprofundaceae bacterium]